MVALRLLILQTIGCFYALQVSFGLLLKFIRRPFFILKKMRQPMSQPPACLLDDRFGSHETIQLKGVKLHFVAKGDPSKPLMLFLHGFPDFWYSWRFQIQEFSKDYRTVAIDIKGFGDSEKPHDIREYLVSTLRQEIIELIEALGYRSCVLVGHDIGATIAYHVTSVCPEIVDKLVVISAPHPTVFVEAIKTRKSQKSKSWYMVLFQVPYIPEALLTIFDFEVLRTMCFGKMGSSVTDEDESAYRYQYMTSGFKSQLAFYRAAFSFQSAAINKVIQTPSLLVWGLCDHYFDVELIELNKQYIPNLKVHAFTTEGHWPHTNSHKETNEVIREFLQAE